MEQVFFVGEAYLKINSLVQTPLHEFMAVKRSGLCAPAFFPSRHIKEPDSKLQSQTKVVGKVVQLNSSPF